MTIEGNYTITIAKLTDWLKTVKKLKPIAACTHDFSRLLSTLQVIIRNSDWFFAPFLKSSNVFQSVLMEAALLF